MIENTNCKKCRRLGAKLFLKGTRCESQNCAMIKKPYPPGQKAKRRKRPLSEYGRELMEKQKLRNWYNLSEEQFARYVRSVILKSKKEEAAGSRLLRTLEARLDNTVYRAGFASSRSQSKQLISHGYFLINGKPVNKSSYAVSSGDIVSVRAGKKKKEIFEGFAEKLKNYNPPSWISLDKEKLEAKIIGEVNVEEIIPPVEIASVFEFYSR